MSQHHPAPEHPGSAPPGPRKQRFSTGAILGTVLVTAVAGFLALGILGAALSADNPPPVDPSAPAAPYPDGDYTIGKTLPPGTYTTPGAKSSPFDLCTLTTDPTRDKPPQLKTANADEPLAITLTEADGTLRVRGCEPLTRGD
ncbi:hypothetical protein [Streptomyces sp. NPDC014894]|uniref:hypothetical protein n=1 Tax=unclassified Streptomyces TaxID=2593676 RepID=UPI0036F80BD5